MYQFTRHAPAASPPPATPVFSFGFPVFSEPLLAASAAVAVTENSKLKTQNCSCRSSFGSSRTAISDLRFPIFGGPAP